MTTAKRDIVRVRRILSIVWAASVVAACGGGDGASRAVPVAAAAGPAAIDVVRVVEQSLDVPLSLPGELTAFQSVAIFPRVTGFVKTVNVDRGSKVRAGDLLASLEAPELVAQRSEAQSKLQAAEAQLSVTRAKADADKSTFARLKAASATPGVVAGNDVVIAEKTADASANQVLAAEQSVEAARQALNAIRDMEGYLRVTAPFAGVITERNVHPGALVGPSTSGAGATPLLRLVDTSRLRLVVPVPEAYTAEMRSGAEIGFTVAAYPGQRFLRQGRAHRSGRGCQHANHGGRVGRGQRRWPARAGHLLSGAMAGSTLGTVAVRAEHERRGDDGPHVCDPHPQRQDGMGRREDWAHVGSIGGSLWRSAGWR